VDEDVKGQDAEVIGNEQTVDEPLAGQGSRISLTEEQGEAVLKEYFEGVKAGVPKDVLDNMTPSILKKEEDKAQAPEFVEKTEGAEKVNAPADEDISKLSPEQITKNYKELQRKFGEQGNELGELRKLKASIATQGLNNNPGFSAPPIAHNIFPVNQPLPPIPEPVQEEKPFDFTDPADIERLAIRAIEKRAKAVHIQQNSQKIMAQMQGFQSAFNQDVQELVNQGISPDEAQRLYTEHFNKFISNPVKTAYREKLHQQEILEAEKRGAEQAIAKLQNATKENPRRAANINSVSTKQGDTDYKNMNPAELHTYIGTLDTRSKHYAEVEKYVLSMAAKER